MTLNVTHTFVSAIPDDPVAAAAGEVLTQSHWNATHTVTGTVGPSVGARTLLTANANVSVTVTGSDSNPFPGPWATTQHAMNFLAENLDFAGLSTTVGIGAGNFVGFGMHTIIGGGNVLFIGAGSASTTLTDGPNDGVFNFGEAVTMGCLCDTILYVNGVTLKSDVIQVAVYNSGLVFAFGNVLTGAPTDIVFDCSLGPQQCFALENYSSIEDFALTTNGTVTVIGGGANINNVVLCTAGVVFLSVNWVFSGALTVNSGTIESITGGIVQPNSQTKTWSLAVGASVTGRRFIVSDNAAIANINNVVFSDPAGTYFPGNAVGQILSGGQYGGITDFVGVVGSLPSANIQGARCFVTDALAATFGSAPTGGHGTFVPVYNNGSAWIMG